MTQIIFKDLSYKLNGLFFKVHNKIGRFCSERQYADEIEGLLKEFNLEYKREYELKNLGKEVKGNRVDFLIVNQILIDIKAKKFLTKEDYFQMLRYLKCSNLKLGLLVNFRNTYLKPKRIINNS